MSLFSTRIAAVAAGATLLVGLGSYGAMASGLIDSHDIKNNSITKADIGKDAVGGSEIINGSVGIGDLNQRAQDALNARAKDGKDGADGNDGKDGVSGVVADGPYDGGALGADQPNSDTLVPAGEVKVVWTSCADGKVAIGGGYRFGLADESFQTAQGKFDGLQVNASEPAFVKDGALANSYGSDAQVTDLGGFRPNAWAVTVQNTGENASNVRAWVVCATAGK